MRVCATLLTISTMLCGCSAAVPSAQTAASADLRSTSVARWAVPRRPDGRASWIAPDAAKRQLLFVSDSGTGDVYLYRLPTLKLVGTITGFTQPQGECSDTKGNVWITDTNATTIYELSHAGHLEARLNDTRGYPDGCAWDPTTGNLAVMNLFGPKGVTGAVLIYRHGSGTPKSYKNPKQHYYNLGGYDNKGNLFFDGRSAGGAFMLSELAKGAASAHSITIKGEKLYFPGMVQWNTSQQNLYVGDQDCGQANAACIYRVSVAQRAGRVQGKITLQSSTGGQVCDLVQGVVFNGQIAGSDNAFCGSDPSTTYLWPRSGGTPMASNDTWVVTPVGAAVSKK